MPDKLLLYFLYLPLLLNCVCVSHCQKLLCCKPPLHTVTWNKNPLSSQIYEQTDVDVGLAQIPDAFTWLYSIPGGFWMEIYLGCDWSALFHVTLPLEQAGGPCLVHLITKVKAQDSTPKYTQGLACVKSVNILLAKEVIWLHPQPR